MSDYADKVREQIEQYRDAPIHDLPDFFHYWSGKYLRPAINDILGVDSVPEFYGASFLQAAEGRAAPFRFLSIGAGDCEVEMSVAQWLIGRGFQDFQIECYELSPLLLERGTARAAEKGLSRHVRPVMVDVNRSAIASRYHAAMANHSLHHIVELEHLFAQIGACLLPGGTFATNDVIGRNGHMRWPEVLEIIHALWPLLPEKKWYNHQLRRVERSFENFDCSGEGFEGVRAQDILPLMVKAFRFKRFVGYGGLTDIFIDRSFGHNFSTKDPWDRDFIDCLQLLNERLIGGGVIKPTQMFALVDLQSEDCRSYRGWSPSFCIRRADSAA